jgi:MerR family gold-responsive transcriptional activator of gol and ges genes
LTFQLLEGVKKPFMTAKAQAYSIGDAARAAGLSAKTIRYYEQIGLIPKAPRRAGTAHTGGDRVYREADVGRLRFIRHARMVDLGLDDIRQLLEISQAGCPSTHPAYAKLLRQHVRAIDERINHLLGLRSAVHQLLNRRSAAGDECCTWETCGCMQAQVEPKPGETRAKEPSHV